MNRTLYAHNVKTAESYVIPEWSPVDMLNVAGGCIALIGGTGSGKTVLLRDILSHVHKEYDSIRLFSRTAKFQDCYDFMPKHCVTDDYDEAEMLEIWDRQAKAVKAGKTPKKVMIILDDVIWSPQYRTSKAIKEIATAARHLNITCIVLSQYFTAIHPAVRANLRIAITFFMQSEREVKKFAEEFLSTDNRTVGMMVLKRVTDGYQCLVAENFKCGKPINERVRRYTANPKVDLKIKDSDRKPRLINKLSLSYK